MPSACIIPTGCMHPLRRKGPKGSAEFERISWDDALDLTAEAMLHGRAALRPGGGVALLLRRHHGPGDARRHQPPAPRQALLAACTPPSAPRWPGPATSPAPAGWPAPIRARWPSPTGGDLGHQSRQHAGQRDDARHARPQGARRQDRGHRHLPQRHHAAGRPGAVPAAGHRRSAGLRRHARAVPRRLRQLAVPGAVHRLPARAGSAPEDAHARSGPAPSPA